MKLVKVVALLLFLGACTNSAPFAPPEEDATGKRYDPPAPGKVAVYVVRPSNFNFAYAINISVGQRMAGTLGGRSWLRVDVDPGRHDIRCHGETRTPSWWTWPLEKAAFFSLGLTWGSLRRGAESRKSIRLPAEAT